MGQIEPSTRRNGMDDDDDDVVVDNGEINNHLDSMSRNMENSGDLVRKGEGLLNQGDLGTAIRFFSNSIKLYPRNWYAFYLRGRARYLQKDFEKALEDLTTSINIEPTYNTEAVFLRGRIYQKVEKFELMLQDFDLLEKSILKPKNYDKMLYIRARYFLLIKETEKGINDLQICCEEKPNKSAYLFLLGQALHRVGKMEDACKYYSKTIELAKDLYDRYFLLRALTYEHMGNVEKALANYEDAEKLCKKNVALYFNRCVTHDKCGKMDLCKEEIEKMKIIDPDFVGKEKLFRDKFPLLFSKKRIEIFKRIFEREFPGESTDENEKIENDVGDSEEIQENIQENGSKLNDSLFEDGSSLFGEVEIDIQKKDEEESPKEGEEKKSSDKQNIENQPDILINNEENEDFDNDDDLTVIETIVDVTGRNNDLIRT